MQSLLQRSPPSNTAGAQPKRTHKQHTSVAQHVVAPRRSLQAACQAPAALASTVELVQQRVRQPEQLFQQNSIVAFSTHRRLEEVRAALVAAVKLAWPCKVVLTRAVCACLAAGATARGATLREPL
jgi:hypothetical protein